MSTRNDIHAIYAQVIFGAVCLLTHAHCAGADFFVNECFVTSVGMKKTPKIASKAKRVKP